MQGAFVIIGYGSVFVEIRSVHLLGLRDGRIINMFQGSFYVDFVKGKRGANNIMLRIIHQLNHNW